MATQAAEVLSDPGDDGSSIIEPQARDFEAEAKSQGWTPQDQFKGDPAKWIDAETFVRRADEVMPLLKKQLQSVRNERDTLRRDLRKVIERTDGMEQRAYDRAVAALEDKIRGAAEVGDAEGALAATKELSKLHKDAPQSIPQATVQEAQEAAIEFREENPWYDRGGLARDYADLLAEKHAGEAKTMRPAEFFGMIADKVRERYGDRLDTPDAAAEDETTPRRKTLSPVEGGSRPRPRGGAVTAQTLTAEERAQADRFIRQGIIKDHADYAKRLKRD